MEFKFFFIGIKTIILDPVKVWKVIYSENKPVKFVRNCYLLPLIILVSVSAFAGSLLFINSELSPVYSIFIGIKCFCLLFLAIYATAYILAEVTYPLDLGKDFGICYRIVVYSMTPFLLCQLLSRLFESLLFVNIIGLYGLYIFWAGAEKLLTPPRHKRMPMLIAAIIIMIGIYLGLDYILSMLTDRVFYAFFA